jgi:hypothetical protein
VFKSHAIPVHTNYSNDDRRLVHGKVLAVARVETHPLGGLKETIRLSTCDSLLQLSKMF